MRGSSWSSRSRRTARSPIPSSWRGPSRLRRRPAPRRSGGASSRLTSVNADSRRASGSRRTSSGEHLITPEPTTPAPVPVTAQTPAPKPPEEYTVTVRGERAAPGGMSLSRAEARMLPSAFGDPFRTIETLAGVTPVVSVVPFFYIRGAPPGNVGFYIDGIRVPLLFHALAGPAVLPPALIERIDVYEGAYPAQFGRYAGAIVAADILPPTDELHAEARVSVLDTSASAQTPFADGKGQVFVSGRAFYPGRIFVGSFTNADLAYWDYQLLSSYELTRSDTVGIFAFGALDHVGDDTGANFAGTQFHRLDLRYDHLFAEGTKARVAVTLGYDNSLAMGGSVTDRSIAARTEIEHRLGGAGVLRCRRRRQFRQLRLDRHGSDRELPRRDDAVSDAPRHSQRRLCGFRSSSRALATEFDRAFAPTSSCRRESPRSAVDPRISAEFSVTKVVKLIDAFGIAHQTPNFIPNLPGAQVGGFAGGLQKTAQYSSGVELALPEDVTTSVTLFDSAFFDLSDPARVLRDDRVQRGHRQRAVARVGVRRGVHGSPSAHAEARRHRVVHIVALAPEPRHDGFAVGVRSNARGEHRARLRPRKKWQSRCACPVRERRADPHAHRRRPAIRRRPRSGYLPARSPRRKAVPTRTHGLLGAQRRSAKRDGVYRGDRTNLQPVALHERRGRSAGVAEYRG